MEISVAVFASFVLVACVNSQNQNVSIETNAGTFIGYRHTVDIGGSNVQLDRFLGIPYAEPPVGNLRFRKPRLKTPFLDAFVAHQYGPGCIQADVFMTGDPTSEDCLFLNIYAPVRSNINTKLPVLVWMYGGGFLFGSSTIYEADVLAAVGDIIVVTINYRLFALGFLDVPNTDSDGNCGLWDQQLAIQWVSDNIEQFGGDKQLVTLAGESAGASSAIYQGFYKGNAGLFQRIIAQSGTSTVSWAFTKDPVGEAKEFAALVGCPADNNQAMVTCLKSLSIDVYLQKILEVAFKGFPIPFRPSLDNDFVTVSPYDIFNKSLDVGKDARSTFASFDLLTGINTAEGGGLLGPSVGVMDLNTFLPNKAEFYDVLIPICLNVTFGEDAHKVPPEFVQAEYTTWDDPSNQNSIRNEFVNMYTDALYIAPMYRTLNLHADTSNRNTYMYRFTATPSSHLFPVAPWLDTTVHGDELLYVFGNLSSFWKMGYQGQFQEWETTLTKDVMKLWAHFVKTGNMSELNESGLDWQPYTSEQQQYLEIVSDLKKSSMKRRLHVKRANLWNNLLPLIANREVTHVDCEDDTTSGARTVLHTSVLIWYIFVTVIYFLMK